MTKAKIWFLAITTALGGFLFGFDTIVINGAEQDIQKLWNLSGQMHGWVVSAALWGTVLGSIAGGKVSDRFGRKNTLFGMRCDIPSISEMAAYGAALRHLC